MSERCRLEVVSTSFNARPYVIRWMLGVYKALKPDEITVVDAGSTDETVVVLRNMGVRVLKIRGVSVGEGKNAAIAAATAERLVLTDLDNRLQRSLPDAAFVRGELTVFVDADHPHAWFAAGFREDFLRWRFPDIGGARGGPDDVYFFARAPVRKVVTVRHLAADMKRMGERGDFQLYHNLFRFGLTWRDMAHVVARGICGRSWKWTARWVALLGVHVLTLGRSQKGGVHVTT